MSPATPHSTARRQVAILYAIFFVSGFCGLIYESIWSHYLKLLLGHAAYAQAVVLVVFVGGLALGAWLTGRFSERIRHPVLLYALVEALVGIFAFAFQRIFEAASAWATGSFLPAVCGDAGSCAASWLLATALILPPSVLLGTTFPLMSAGVMRMGVQAGRGLSLLYFLNSAGAALGVIGAGFVLIPALGLPGTMLLAGSMNILVALGALIAWHKGEDVAGEAHAVQAAAPVPARLRLLLLVAALTGLSSFIYEVVWIRMLTLVFGAATHSFELMLAPFILGLAFGAWWIRNRIEGQASPLRLLGTIQVAMGVLAVATLPLYASLYDVMAFALRNLVRSEESYTLYLTMTATMAAAVMLPATFCAGMTLPLITAILLRHGHGERQIGQVYGVNTFGAIAGVLLSVHVLMPLLGLKWSLAFGAAVDVALGVALWRMASASAPAGTGTRWQLPRGLAIGAAAALAALVVVPFVSPLGEERLASGVFRGGVAREEARIVFHRDGKTATVSVTESSDGIRTLKTNGKPDGSSHPERKVPTVDDPTQVLLGALGPAHHPAAKRAAVIGLGTGTTSAVLLEVRSLEVVDTIEIEPMMVEAAQLFRPRSSPVFDDPRSRIVIDDARAHFSKARSRYDIIVSEPSNPWVSGVAGLFTTEFYRHVSGHLAEEGHFVQWLHLYETSPQVVGSILRAFGSVFPEFVAYAPNSADVVLVARRDGKPPVLDGAALDRMEGLRTRLAEVGITSAAMLQAHSAGRSGPIRVLAQSYGAPPNSDYFPYVDNRAADDRFIKRSFPSVFKMPEAPVNYLEFADGAPPYAGKVGIANARMPDAVRFLAAGWQGYRYVQGQPLAPEEAQAIQGVEQEFGTVQTWVRHCAMPAGTGAVWAPMVRVASFINPAVPAAEAAAFWKEIRQRCAARLSPLQAQWLDLFAAVGGRDAAASAETGRRVLAVDPNLTLEGRGYATLAAVGGLVMLGQRAEAAPLLVEQRKHLPAHTMEQPWFRLLVLTLATPPQQPGGAGRPATP